MLWEKFSFIISYCSHKQMDIKSVFLQGKNIEHELYLKPPSEQDTKNL